MVGIVGEMRLMEKKKMGCKTCEKIQTKSCPNCNKETIISWKIAMLMGEKKWLKN